MTRVYSARDLAEAHFVKGLLATEQIPAVIESGALQAVLGAIPVNPESLPSVWVEEEYTERAMQIIGEMQHGGPAATEAQRTWTCPRCGEVLEGQFSNCWKCGTPRPEAAPPA